MEGSGFDSEKQRPENHPLSLKDEGVAAEISSHYDNLKSLDKLSRKNSSIVNIRDVNNNLKFFLIEHVTKMVRRQRRVLRDSVDGSVLDLCCGRGGDIFKWIKVGIGEYYGLDISKKSIETGWVRYNSSVNKEFGRKHAEIQLCPTMSDMKKDEKVRELVDAFKDADKHQGTLRKSRSYIHFDVFDCFHKTINNNLWQRKFDIVSCMFGFHYAFESMETLRIALGNILYCLSSRGYVIMTIPDDAVINSYIHKGGPFTQNSIFKLEFIEKSLFGRGKHGDVYNTKYKFTLSEAVDDCIEFTINSRFLLEIMDAHGLKFLDCIPLHQIYGRRSENQMTPLSRIYLDYMRNKFHIEGLNVGNRCKRTSHSSSKTNGKKSIMLNDDERMVLNIYIGYVFRREV